MDYEERRRTESMIRCIFLSEFDIVRGSKISCQYPDNYISKDIFHAINVYIIPKPKTLSSCILTVNTLNYKIIGYPVRIDSPKYARNAYYFNLCFVCDHWAISVHFEPIIKKLAEYFTLLEEENEFLSSSGNYDRIQKILQKTMHDLNEKRVTTIVEGETTIYLKIIEGSKEDPPPVMDHLVPEWNSEFSQEPLDNWDLTTQQLLPYIDGYNHVAKISAFADVENTLVKACLQNLAYYGLVTILPLIKYSNVYICTRNLQNLVKDQNFFLKCRDYITLSSPAVDETENGEEEVEQQDNTLQKPSLHKIFQLYASMKHGVSLKMICERFKPRSNSIDERKLVSFGLKNKIIRQINKYPIFVGSVSTGRRKFYNGFFSLDEILIMTGLTPSKIEADFDLDTNVTVLWK